MSNVRKLEAANITLSEIIDRTEALLPAIGDRALQTERDRNISIETIREIRAAGLDRVMQPQRWGGFGLDVDAFFEICWRLSSACGSTGWVYAQSAMQKWSLSHASDKALADLFQQRDVRTCCAFNPRGAHVEPVPGGWNVTGRWQWASGCLHADWALLAAMVPESPAPVLLLVPKEDFLIEDTWHVSGLRGTASNDIVIDQPLFVPGHRFAPMRATDDTALMTYGNGSFGAPQASITPWGVVTPVIGMAQGALRAYEDSTRDRLSAFGGQKVAQMVGPQMRISEAAAKIDAARALARNDISEAIERGKAGDSFSTDDRVRFRRDHAFIVNLCYDATMMLARAAGANSLFDTNPIQRFLRDVHAGSMQIASNWDEQAESYGRVRMGGEPNGSMW